MDRAALVTMIALCGCNHAAETSPSSHTASTLPLVVAPAAAPRVRVMTFNVNFGVADAMANLEAIESLDADVVLLQETTAESEDRFRDALSDRYPNILWQDCCNAGGLGVLSKYPIAWDEYLQPDAGWFPGWLVAVQTPIGEVQFLYVHLRPPVSDSGSWVTGHFSTRKIRAQEIEGFWTAVDTDVPVIVAGDFNEGADGRAVQFLADKGMRSALVQVNPKADTWHWPLKVGELSSMLDHIVYDARLSLLRADVHELGRSDHYPVVAEFGLAP
ncbi:MAG: endonuclease/exonuclease/phosphatase family protein [Nannocystales bacterium]